jgi:ribosome biogenesis GTPase
VPSSEDTGYTHHEAEAFAERSALGWDERWATLFAEVAGVRGDLEPARVVRLDRGLPLVATAGGLERVELATHLEKSSDHGAHPAVGDWLAISRPVEHLVPIVEAVLERRTAFVRKDPGEVTVEQVLVANVDVALITQSLSGDGINLRRLERELVLAYSSGARPAVVLTKSDLVEEAELARAAVAEIAAAVEVVVESAVTGDGIEAVRALVPRGSTAALIGASGVGKSTLVNLLLGGESQAVAEVRASDDKGRHTTVAREMLLVPGGGVIIDTPGMRALALYDAIDGMAAAFPDIADLAEYCRFRDCTHGAEPGCAVIDAAESGEIQQARLDSYRRLIAELDDVARRRDEQSWHEPERQAKAISKAAKRYFQQHPGKK